MVKGGRANLVWGLALLLIGAYFLAYNLDWAPEPSGNAWAFVFGGLGLLFLVGYLASGWQNWGLLFPATGCGAIAAIIWLAEAEADGPYLGGLFLLAISIPFWVAFLTNRTQNWWALIPGWAMAIIGVIVSFSDAVEGELIGALVMFALAVPFLVVFLSNRAYWWALIPAYSLSVIGAIVLLSDTAQGEIIGALVMLATAVPFFVVYLLNRSLWWALIPGGVMGLIGLILLLVSALPEEMIGAFVMFAIALPFFLVYWRAPTNWWSLIPAGVLASIGLTAALSALHFGEALAERILGGVFLAGLAATFGGVWYVQKGPETEWAKFPAAGLAVAALLVGVFGFVSEVVLALALMILGVWLLYRAARLGTKSP